MCQFAPDFDRLSAGFSPDRVDALVWAFTALLVEPMSNEGFYFWAKEKAASLQPKKPPLPEPIAALYEQDRRTCRSPIPLSPRRARLSRTRRRARCRAAL